ncbi:hypothetical protein [Saccharopolyspora sp. NPDC050642]|uniref:hypothetical protein n=1 Tax=Saccharopolyspora sp. NPDC050642 TaxID=3157099 RepID=UPI00340A1615
MRKNTGKGVEKTRPKCDQSYNCPADLNDHKWNCESLGAWLRTAADKDGDVMPGDEG